MRTRWVSVAVTAALTVGLSATPSAARTRPDVIARSNVVIPWHSCQGTGRWTQTFSNPGTRVDSASVIAVRKPGYTFPVSEYRVCGYMGSGTYSLRIKVWWSKKHWVKKRVPVYRFKDVQKEIGETSPEPIYEDWPFTCSKVDASSGPDWTYSWYNCPRDNGVPWPTGVYNTPLVTKCVSTLPSELAVDWPWNGNMPTQPSDYERVWVVGDGSPDTFTGTVTVRTGQTEPQPTYETVQKRYIHHYRTTKVQRWVRQTPFTVERNVRVDVR